MEETTMEKNYLDYYKMWLESKNITEEDRKELLEIKDDDKEIENRFYTDLSFGTAGMRGVRGVGRNRINNYNIRKATQGLANYILASIASDFVGRRMFGMETSFNLIANYPKNINPYYQFILYIILGIVIAFFGKLFTLTLIKVQDKFKELKISRWIKMSFVMSTSLLFCYFLPEVTGGGHELVEEMAGGNRTIQLLIIIFLAKLFFTALCYATGFAGGIFLPMLVLGAIIGKIYGLTLIKYLGVGLDFVPHFMVLGMAGYFVAVVRAPITGAVLILEMTGNFDHLLALVTVSVVAYYVTELLGLEPIYEILFKRMPKDTPMKEEDSGKKTIITVPVMAESELDGKTISEIKWAEDVLVVAICRNEHEIIPKGNSVIESGDVLTLLLPEAKVYEMKELLYKQGGN
jgi:hypothetical protein